MTSANLRPDILTISGTYFNFLDPQPEMFTTRDIMWGLSHVCRFAGQCKSFYSVAQHSVLVSEQLPPELALAGLLHDAAEAFIGDVTAPLKKLLPQYKEIEQRVERCIFEKYGLPYPLPPEVKQVDLRMLATEQLQLAAPHEDEWGILRGIHPYKDMHITPLDPASARGLFLRRFNLITRKDIDHEP